MRVLTAPFRLPYGRGVTDVNQTLAPSRVGQGPYGPGAGEETRGAGGPLVFSTRRVPSPVATSKRHSSAVRAP